jgi:uncharacterized membrane protein
MHKGRLEAFSDAVIAILMTIMVLELHAPHGPKLSELQAAVPTLLGYLLSFVFLGIYWNNHHHMLQAVKNVNGAVLWANMHLLFWLSLIPFSTEWMGGQWNSQWPVAFYGVILLMSGIAYFILQRTLIAADGKESTLAKALGSDFKGKISVGIYAIAIGLAWDSRSKNRAAALGCTLLTGRVALRPKWCFGFQHSEGQDIPSVQ